MTDRELLKEANELLRSAHAIAARNGEKTNWEGFKASLEKVLITQSKVLNNTEHLPAATCTPRVYKELPTD